MYLSFLKLFLIFLVLSFIGYICEIIYCSYLAKKFVNRGFLFGPVCPIYGIGGLLIIWLLADYRPYPLLVFLLGVFITAVVEYYTSYLFEKVFNNKWWDYSDKKYNINGRVCLENCVLFGIGALLGIYVFDPLFTYLINKIPDNLIIIIGTTSLILLIIDLIYSVRIAYNLRTKLIVAEKLKQEKIKLIPAMLEKRYKTQIMKLKNMRNRLLKNYPIFTNNLHKELDFISKVIDKNNVKKRKKSKKN